MSYCTASLGRMRFNELSRPRGRLSSTGSPTASYLLIRRTPYSTLPHEVLGFGEGPPCVRRSEADWVAFHDSEELGPAILAKISKKTGLSPTTVILTPSPSSALTPTESPFPWPSATRHPGPAATIKPCGGAFQPTRQFPNPGLARQRSPVPAQKIAALIH